MSVSDEDKGTQNLKTELSSTNVSPVVNNLENNENQIYNQSLTTDLSVQGLSPHSLHTSRNMSNEELNFTKKSSEDFSGNIIMSANNLINSNEINEYNPLVETDKSATKTLNFNVSNLNNELGSDENEISKLKEQVSENTENIVEKVNDILKLEQEEEQNKEEIDEEIDHKSFIEESPPPLKNESDTKEKRKSIFSTNELIKDSTDLYKIDIPLKKKVNKNAKKKLWREIQKRKPFISENVAAHIRNYGKPPFVTWGCKNCEFRYEI
ncbi:hypothetical protein PGB90_002629 [Kerria lacca]